MFLSEMYLNTAPINLYPESITLTKENGDGKGIFYFLLLFFFKVEIWNTC